MTAKTVLIIQARMGSTRLPGKVLKRVLGRTLLEHLLERMRRCRLVDEVVVATTESGADAAIVEVCRRLGVICVRGPEDDVLERYHIAARARSASAVARVTSDCPLLDPAVVDFNVACFRDHPEYGFVSNSPDEGEPRTYPRGMDVEVFSSESLEQAARDAKDPAEREHVTPYFRRRPHHYRCHYLSYGKDLSDYRLTVDTPEDFELVRRVIEALYPEKPEYTLEDIHELLRERPEWLELNRHVAQKKV